MTENESVSVQAGSARDEYGLVQMANLVASCRSFRRFDEGRRVPEGFLLELVDMARLCANGANRQLLRFRVVSDPAACDAVFAELACWSRSGGASYRLCSDCCRARRCGEVCRAHRRGRLRHCGADHDACCAVGYAFLCRLYA